MCLGLAGCGAISEVPGIPASNSGAGQAQRCNIGDPAYNITTKQNGEPVKRAQYILLNLTNRRTKQKRQVNAVSILYYYITVMDLLSPILL